MKIPMAQNVDGNAEILFSPSKNVRPNMISPSKNVIADDDSPLLFVRASDIMVVE